MQLIIILLLMNSTHEISCLMDYIIQVTEQHKCSVWLWVATDWKLLYLLTGFNKIHNW